MQSVGFQQKKSFCIIQNVYFSTFSTFYTRFFLIPNKNTCAKQIFSLIIHVFPYFVNRFLKGDIHSISEDLRINALDTFQGHLIDVIYSYL